MKLLTFKIAGEIFGVSIDQVKEVLEVTQMTKIARVNEFIRGVIHLRGDVIPVIDVRMRIGRPPAGFTKDTCIIILEISQRKNKVVYGALVDSVQEVIDIDPATIEPAPAIGLRLNAAFLHGIGKLDQGLLLILNLTTCFSFSLENDEEDTASAPAVSVVSHSTEVTTAPEPPPAMKPASEASALEELPEAGHEPEAEVEPEPEAEPEPEVESESESGPEPEAEVEPEAEPEAEPEQEIEAEPEAEVESEAEAESEPEPEPEVDTEPEDEVEVEPEDEAEPEPESEPEVETEPEADLGTEVDAEPVDEDAAAMVAVLSKMLVDEDEEEGADDGAERQPSHASVIIGTAESVSEHAELGDEDLLYSSGCHVEEQPVDTVAADQSDVAWKNAAETFRSEQLPSVISDDSGDSEDDLPVESAVSDDGGTEAVTEAETVADAAADTTQEEVNSGNQNQGDENQEDDSTSTETEAINEACDHGVASEVGVLPIEPTGLAKSSKRKKRSPPLPPPKTSLQPTMAAPTKKQQKQVKKLGGLPIIDINHVLTRYFRF
ncbi:MAG: chemotaxis protein CheW [Magnetococcales bacterium]|nr:chemotaxis protein CheW [Magnetococcales bacterium]